MVSCRWLLAGKRLLRNSRSGRRHSNPSAKPCSRHRRLWKKRVENMLLLKRHVQAWNTKSKRRKKDQDEEMHEEDQNNTRSPYRDWYNSSDCTAQSRELKEMYFADLRYPCTSAKNSSPCCCGSWYDGENAADSCTADRCTCGGNCKRRRPDRVSCPCNSKAASDGSRGGARSSWYDSSWKLCRRCYECTEPFSAAHPNGTDRISKQVC